MKDINITYMFPRDTSIDASNTYQPLYDLTASIPNWRAWNTTFLYGTPQFMIYITDMLVMLLSGHRFDDVEFAFIPMKTPEFTQMEPFAATQLTMIFPFFYMCIYLLPLYYMVTKIAEDKESRGREGMKMMGLRDETYFLAWFIFLGIIVVGMSMLLVLTAKL